MQNCPQVFKCNQNSSSVLDSCLREPAPQLGRRWCGAREGGGGMSMSKNFKNVLWCSLSHIPIFGFYFSLDIHSNDFVIYYSSFPLITPSTQPPSYPGSLWVKMSLQLCGHKLLRSRAQLFGSYLEQWKLALGCLAWLIRKSVRTWSAGCYQHSLRPPGYTHLVCVLATLTKRKQLILLCLLLLLSC